MLCSTCAYVTSNLSIGGLGGEGTNWRYMYGSRQSMHLLIYSKLEVRERRREDRGEGEGGREGKGKGEARGEGEG